MIRGAPAFCFLIWAFISSFFTSLSFGQKNGSEGIPVPKEIPLYSQSVSAAGVKIHFIEVGRGETLLFLHGLGGSWKDWTANLQSFAPSYQAIAMDFPGFGDSDKPEADYSIEWLTRIVENFLLELKIMRVSVVGHSMGALVALNLAAQTDSRVKNLIVADAVGIGDKAEFLSYALTKKIMGPDSRWESVEGVLRDEFKAMIESFIKIQKPKTSKEFFQSVPKSPFTGKPLLPMTPAVQMSASIIDFNVLSKLSLIHQPTLILWGSKDPIAPLQDASYLKSKIPRATLAVLQGCGHSPMQEQPARFNQEVWKFLQAAESGSSR
jgi:4,5:9,10-diseco-3-hydroxy-5,9,17-trioxoandrosta-1(10),2-diene-4-oate hydrolase